MYGYDPYAKGMRRSHSEHGRKAIAHPPIGGQQLAHRIAEGATSARPILSAKGGRKWRMFKCQATLARMKLYAGSQSGNEPDRQNHSGDHPRLAAFDLRHLQFAAGNELAAEQRPHPRQPRFSAE